MKFGQFQIEKDYFQELEQVSSSHVRKYLPTDANLKIDEADAVLKEVEEKDLIIIGHVHGIGLAYYIFKVNDIAPGASEQEFLLRVGKEQLPTLYQDVFRNAFRDERNQKLINLYGEENFSSRLEEINRSMKG